MQQAYFPINSHACEPFDNGLYTCQLLFSAPKQGSPKIIGVISKGQTDSSLAVRIVTMKCAVKTIQTAPMLIKPTPWSDWLAILDDQVLRCNGVGMTHWQPRSIDCAGWLSAETLAGAVAGKINLNAGHIVLPQ